MAHRNQIPKTEFILQHIIWLPLLTMSYSAVMFQPAPFLSPGQSKLLLWCLAAVCFGSGCLVTQKRHRNTANMIISFLIPYEFYTYIAYGTYCPSLTNLSWGIALILSSLFSAWIFLQPEPAYSDWEKVMVSRIKHSLIGFRSISALCFLSILFWGLAAQLNGGIPAAGFPSSSGEPLLSEREITGENIDTLSLLLPEQWEPLSSAEKMDVLQEVADMERAYLGLPFELILKTDTLENPVIGSYRHADHQITIDTVHLTYSPPEKVLATILHESYHAYQHTLTNLYLDSDTNYRGLRIFRRTHTYAEEFASYTDGSSDLDQYAAQLVEIDARSYAEATVLDYYSKLEEYKQLHTPPVNGSSASPQAPEPQTTQP